RPSPASTDCTVRKRHGDEWAFWNRIDVRPEDRTDASAAGHTSAGPGSSTCTANADRAGDSRDSAATRTVANERSTGTGDTATDRSRADANGSGRRVALWGDSVDGKASSDHGSCDTYQCLSCSQSGAERLD